jgi:hypothetical protein
MSDISREEADAGTIAALLERANRRIPNLLAIKKRLENGDTLSQIEIEELDNMIEANDHSRELVERHPEYHDLVARVVSLIEEITRLAVANEENAGKR